MQFNTLPAAGNRFHLNLIVAYRISYGDFAVLCDFVPMFNIQI